MLLSREMIIADLVDYGYVNSVKEANDNNKFAALSDSELLVEYFNGAYDEGYFGDMDKSHVTGIATENTFTPSEVTVEIDSAESEVWVQFHTKFVDGYDQDGVVAGTEQLAINAKSTAEMALIFDPSDIDVLTIGLKLLGFAVDISKYNRIMM